VEQWWKGLGDGSHFFVWKLLKKIVVVAMLLIQFSMIALLMSAGELDGERGLD
jgi:hypothetical protein